MALEQWKSSLFWKNDATAATIFSMYFGAWPEAHGIPISILNSHKTVVDCISYILQEQKDSRFCIFSETCIFFRNMLWTGIDYIRKRLWIFAKIWKQMNACMQQKEISSVITVSFILSKTLHCCKAPNIFSVCSHSWKKLGLIHLFSVILKYLSGFRFSRKLAAYPNVVQPININNL